MLKKVSDVLSFRFIRKTKEPVETNNNEEVDYHYYEGIPDPINREGIALSDALVRLWKAVAEYRLQPNMDTDSVRFYFEKLSTYPFKDVVICFKETLRNDVTRVLGLRAMPYTTKQAEALERLLTLYQASDKDFYFAYRDTADAFINVANDDLISASRLASLREHVTFIYNLPKRLLWMYIDPVMQAIERILVKDPEDHLQLRALKTYLYPRYTTIKGKQLSTVTTQLVEDVITLLSFTSPHPEVCKAYREILKTKSFMIDPDVLKTMSYVNIYDKMEAYLKACEGFFPEEEEEVTPPSNEETIKQKLKRLEECVNALIINPDETGLRQETMELIVALERMPYQDIMRYAVDLPYLVTEAKKRLLDQ